LAPRAAISWSGGKDSCAALHRASKTHDIVSMITMFDAAAARSRSHGLRPEVVAAQAERLGLRQVVGRCTWPTYNAVFGVALDEVAADGITYVVFGDILFPEHRQWAEEMCAPRGLVAVEPLFGSSTRALFVEWVSSGAEAVIVTTRAEKLDATWLGRTLSMDMLADFERLDVDPCGERGEYHTVVTNSPLFREPLALSAGEQVSRSGCWALDVAIGESQSTQNTLSTQKHPVDLRAPRALRSTVVQ
jgi:diphthine-ammonia ligase